MPTRSHMPQPLALVFALSTLAGCAHQQAGAPTSPVGTAAYVAEELSQRCDADDADACGLLGLMTGKGYLGPDLGAATYLDKKACEAGSARGCQEYAGLYWGSDEISDQKQGLKYERKACEMGWAASCFHAARKLVENPGLFPGEDAAFFLEKGCALWNTAGCNATEMASSPESIPSGGIPRSEVLSVIKSAEPAIKACYDNELARDPQLCGTVKTLFLIESNGEVPVVAIEDSTLRNQSVENCLVRVLTGLQFPAFMPGGSANIAYPFVFRTSEPCDRDASPADTETDRPASQAQGSTQQPISTSPTETPQDPGP